MKVMLVLLIGIAAVVFIGARLYIKEAKRQKKRREAIREANEAMEKSVKEVQRIKSTPPVMPAVGEGAAQ